MGLERLVVGELETNCYILESAGEAVIIDPGAAEERLLEALGGHQLRYILLTHGHPDHLGGAPLLKRAWRSAALLLHQGDLPLLRWALPGLEPDGFLSEGDTIAFGEETLGVLHTPGHSPGSLVFGDDERLFVGDLLFWGSIGRTDLPGGSPSAMERSLRRLLELDGDLSIYPGHGPETTLAQERISNPFLRELQRRWLPERS